MFMMKKSISTYIISIFLFIQYLSIFIFVERGEYQELLRLLADHRIEIYYKTGGIEIEEEADRNRRTELLVVC